MRIFQFGYWQSRVRENSAPPMKPRFGFIMDEIEKIIDFVEGKIDPKKFELCLHSEPSFETLLDAANGRRRTISE